MIAENSQPLLHSCILVVIDNMNKCGTWELIKDFPSHIKYKILDLCARRGLISDENIQMFLFKNLQVLNLSQCDAVGDEGLTNVKVCGSLKMLNLNAEKFSRHQITSKGLSEVFKSCTHLHSVEIRGCVSVTDEAIEHLAKYCSKLSILNIRDCTGLTDKSLKALGNHSSFLKSINFSWTEMTDEGVLCLAFGLCSNTLKEIIMEKCLRLTDVAVEGVIVHCPSVVIFAFHGCPEIGSHSGEIVQEVLQQKSRIKQLSWTVQ
ncbi:protein AMN1 homolog isoform X1 [Tachypleus tridentatus]|uniref:protein AMN1 homolog isoform X1 n=2 Tax=Tachypleus tridentatus TaxID=6853 RepID=UPI003FD60C85